MSKVVNLNRVSVAILAGGHGTRIESVAEGTAKAMLKFNGYPFLGYLISHFLRLGINEILIMAGGKKDEISKTFGTIFWRFMGVRVLDDRLSFWEHSLGTGGAVGKALKETTKESIFVCNGDTILQMNFLELYAQFLRWGYPVGIPVTFNKGVQNESAILVQENTHRVVQFNEGGHYRKIRPTKNGFFRASNVGAGFYKTEVRELLLPGSCLYQGFTHNLVGQGEVCALPIGHTHTFLDFGVPERYRCLKKHEKILPYIYGVPFSGL